MTTNMKISDCDAQLRAEILPQAALDFIGDLHARFNPRRLQLLEQRQQRQQEINSGKSHLGFLANSAEIRSSDWQVAPIPENMRDRRVEITGPVERKMMINALNSGAKVFMADFEDAHAPGWQETLAGQQNVKDYYRSALQFTSPEGKHYALKAKHALLMLRVRGWHLPEKNIVIDGEPASGALADFALILFHNHQAAQQSGKPIYLYLPKMESHLEARLWNDVFAYAEAKLGIKAGSTRCTALIETLPAVFEMHEILYELRNYITALNCGRWDYIFSYIKSFQNNPSKILPDRAQVGMQQPFLRAYSQLLVQTCHRRGAYAMGGMAAQIPIKNDPEANEQAFTKVRLDKEREADNGHDGTWVAHPGLVSVAMEVFERKLGGKLAQLDAQPDKEITEKDLLTPCSGSISEEGFADNVNAALRYTYAWLEGSGAVPINNLMEDVATAEISRSQLWQWLRHKAQFADQRPITTELFQTHLQLAKTQVEQDLGSASASLDQAAQILQQIVLAAEFVPFLTLPAYEHLK